MVKELERAGIPAVLVCTIVPLAESIGPNRIVGARAVTHPLGDPKLPREQEKALRKQIVQRALEALRTDAGERLVIPLER